MSIENLISVIIPVYNVEQFVEKCIRSVASNTYRNLEILCIDDGSPDASGAILDRLAEEDDRIIPIHQKNGGVAAARNRGLELAKGEYVAFVDSDDYIHPSYFQSMMECLQTTGANLVVCQADKVDEETKIDYPDCADIQWKQLDADQFFKSYYARHMVWGRIYRKQDLDRIRFSPEVRYSDDTLYNLCVLHGMENPVVFETGTPLYYYLMRVSSMVHSVKTEKIIDFGNWYFLHRNELKKNNSSWQWMLPMHALKLTLSYRYEAIMSGIDKAAIQNANRVLQACYKDISSDPFVPDGQKYLHFFMIKFPGLYRRFRLKDDPTMKTWEKKLRVRNNGKNR